MAKKETTISEERLEEYLKAYGSNFEDLLKIDGRSRRAAEGGYTVDRVVKDTGLAEGTVKKDLAIIRKSHSQFMSEMHAMSALIEAFRKIAREQATDKSYFDEVTVHLDTLAAWLPMQDQNTIDKGITDLKVAIKQIEERAAIERAKLMTEMKKYDKEHPEELKKMLESRGMIRVKIEDNEEI